MPKLSSSHGKMLFKKQNLKLPFATHKTDSFTLSQILVTQSVGRDVGKWHKSSLTNSSLSAYSHVSIYITRNSLCEFTLEKAKAYE